MSENTSSDGAFYFPIDQAGNFFIMDTEQVISNPYQDLQSEAVDGPKKASMTERLTTVRNNVCEYNLRTKQSHLDRERTHSLRNMHMDSSNLRYQVKVMDLNRRKNELSLQKRIMPKKDFSYDSRQIANSAKRLGISSESSFYLQKRLQYPLRGHIVKDHNQKPIIKKARKTMADHSIRKKYDDYESDRVQTASGSDRVFTAQTVSTTVEMASPEPLPRAPQSANKIRIGSKSAPPPKIAFSEPQRSASKLSIIDEKLVDEVDGKLPSISNNGNNQLHRRGSPNKSHVKFNDNVKQDFLRRSSGEGQVRPKTCYSDMPRVTRSYGDYWDSDSDDDYIYCEKVDLRALFFGEKSQGSDTKSSVSGNTTPHNMHTRMSSDALSQRRCSSGKAPKVTEEMMIKEQNMIKGKVTKFLGTMKAKDIKPKKEEVKVTEKEKLAKKKDELVMSKAAVLLSVFTKPLDKDTKGWSFLAHRPKDEDKVEEKKPEDDKPKADDSANGKRGKNLWDLIKTSVQSGNMHRKYTANDLLLQQLTGILVQADKKPKVPIHAASRALRHTPTFKMRRVVEELMKQRTRYEQQEVERLQKADNVGAGGMYPCEEEPTPPPAVQKQFTPRAWASPTKELESAA